MTFEVVTEIEDQDKIVQVRKYPDGRYDVGYLIDDVFDFKHPMLVLMVLFVPLAGI